MDDGDRPYADGWQGVGIDPAAVVWLSVRRLSVGPSGRGQPLLSQSLKVLLGTQQWAVRVFQQESD